jgi:MFS family permease
MTTPTKIVQLSVLTFAVAISQAFRTVPAITVSGVAEEINAGPAALALFGGIFHWSFALMQIPVGLALDIFGVRHTMVTFSGFAILGGAICASAPNINWLFLGQTLIGIGCAPAFMAAIVFTSKHWPIRAPSDRASRARVRHVRRLDHDQRSVDRANGC